MTSFSVPAFPTLSSAHSPGRPPSDTRPASDPRDPSSLWNSVHRPSVVPTTGTSPRFSTWRLQPWNGPSCGRPIERRDRRCRRQPLPRSNTDPEPIKSRKTRQSTPIFPREEQIGRDTLRFEPRYSAAVVECSDNSASYALCRPINAKFDESKKFPSEEQNAVDPSFEGSAATVRRSTGSIDWWQERGNWASIGPIVTVSEFAVWSHLRSRPRKLVRP